MARRNRPSGRGDETAMSAANLRVSRTAASMLAIARDVYGMTTDAVLRRALVIMARQALNYEESRALLGPARVQQLQQLIALDHGEDAE